MTTKHAFKGFVSWSEDCLIGFVFCDHGVFEFEPNSPDIETAIDDIGIGLATGSSFSDLFCPVIYPSMWSGLASAKRWCGKTLKGDRHIWYFEIEITVDDAEDSEEPYKYISFFGDENLRPKELKVAS